MWILQKILKIHYVQSLRKFVKIRRVLRKMKFFDIGANLTDTMYSGEYNGSSKHPPDLDAVLERAKNAGVVKMMVTGGNLEVRSLKLTVLC